MACSGSIMIMTFSILMIKLNCIVKNNWHKLKKRYEKILIYFIRLLLINLIILPKVSLLTTGKSEKHAMHVGMPGLTKTCILEACNTCKMGNEDAVHDIHELSPELYHSFLVCVSCL